MVIINLLFLKNIYFKIIINNNNKKKEKEKKKRKNNNTIIYRNKKININNNKREYIYYFIYLTIKTYTEHIERSINMKMTIQIKSFNPTAFFRNRNFTSGKTFTFVLNNSEKTGKEVV